MKAARRLVSRLCFLPSVPRLAVSSREENRRSRLMCFLDRFSHSSCSIYLSSLTKGRWTTDTVARILLLRTKENRKSPERKKERKLNDDANTDNDSARASREHSVAEEGDRAKEGEKARGDEERDRKKRPAQRSQNLHTFCHLVFLSTCGPLSSTTT